jgi:hypothetical protein
MKILQTDYPKWNVYEVTEEDSKKITDNIYHNV